MTRGLHYVSHMGTIGYAVAARRLMRALRDAGVELTWTPIADFTVTGGPNFFLGEATGDPDLDPLLHVKLDCDTILLHTMPELMPHWLDRKGARRVIGYTVWETDRVQAHWIPILNRLDRLFVPCTWNRDVFRAQGVRVPISVLPHLPGPSRPARHPRWATIPERDLVFYCIETWSVRKNLEETITLFRRCFGAGDGVRLVVKTTPRPEGGHRIQNRPALRALEPLVRRMPSSLRRKISFLWREDARMRLRRLEASSPGGARVDLVTDVLTATELEGLHERGDCYFSLTHGEGWGLGAYDAASAGKPVITTGWGGVLDFLPPGRGGRVAWDPVLAWGRERYGHWAQPRPEHAIALLRAFHADPGSARRRAREHQAELHDQFGEARVVRLLKEAL